MEDSCTGAMSSKGSASEAADRSTSSRILTAISESETEDRNEKSLIDDFSGRRRCGLGAGCFIGAHHCAIQRFLAPEDGEGFADQREYQCEGLQRQGSHRRGAR